MKAEARFLIKARNGHIVDVSLRVDVRIAGWNFELKRVLGERLEFEKIFHPTSMQKIIAQVNSVTVACRLSVLLHRRRRSHFSEFALCNSFLAPSGPAVQRGSDVTVISARAPTPDISHFVYSRHFFLLACAVGVIMVCDRIHWFAEPFVPTFALNGMLHAATLAATSRETQPLWRRGTFVVVAGTLSVLTFYVGRWALHALSGLPFGVQVYYVLGLCAGTGAISYGFLIRTFWLPNITPRAILAIAMGCALATCAALFTRSFFYGLDGWWLASAWWFAFSGGLWYCDTRPASARR